jgi:hypothetical protein
MFLLTVLFFAFFFFTAYSVKQLFFPQRWARQKSQPISLGFTFNEVLQLLF